MFSITVLPSIAHSAALYVDCQTEHHLNYLCSNKERFVYIFAKVDRATTLRLEEIDASISRTNEFPAVYLNSIGGDIYEAMRIGEIFRARNATVKSFDVFNPQSLAICESACLLLAAGATTRNLDEIGIHQPHYEVWQGQSRTRSAADDKHIQAEETYFKRMGIPDELINLMRNTPYDTVKRFFYTDKLPLETQEISRFGFRMQINDGIRTQMERSFREYDPTTVMSELRTVASSGDKDAAFTLGFMYYFEQPETSSNQRQGIRWLSEAARLKRNKAAEVLGMIYAGEFHRKHRDIPASIRYYQQAAESGCPISQNNLGEFYIEGLAVERDLMKASFWISKAAMGGLSHAYGSLGSFWLKTDPSPLGRTQAYRWLRIASETMKPGPDREEILKELHELTASIREEKIAAENDSLKEWKALGLYYRFTQHPCD